MNYKFFYLLAFIVALPASADSTKRALYLEPSTEAPVIVWINPEDPAVQSAVLALGLDSGSGELWRWTEYPSTYTVFVPDEAVSKNYEIAPGTPARLQPQQAAPVLSRIKMDDAYEIRSNESGWTQIELTKAIPLYLHDPVPSVPVQAAAAPTQAEMIPAEPTGLNRELQFDPSVGVSTTAPTSLPPENTVWVAAGETARPATVAASEKRNATQAPAAADGIVVGPEATAAVRPPQNPANTPGSITRTLAGTLERSLPSAFGGPRYPLRLNATGRNKRIAYVDLSRLFIRDLRPFLGRSVHLTGEVRPLVPGSEELVIRARTLRIVE